MSRNQDLKQKRNARIRKRYQELRDKKVKGRELYKHQAILAMMEDEFCLTCRTIEDIINE